MARPLRPHWRVRISVRRRHRTWMSSMILATMGWGVWWFSLLLFKYLPEAWPGLRPTYVVTCLLAGVGFLLALFTVRAKLIWVLLAGVPMFANGSLLLVPIVLGHEVSALLETAPTGAAPAPPPQGE